MTVLVSKNGEVIGHIFGNEEMIKLNTPEGCVALDDPPYPNMFYQGGWVEMPAQPRHIISSIMKLRSGSIIDL